MTFKVCNWLLPLSPKTKILISVPHAGTHIPPKIQDQLLLAFKNHCPDTDWFVDELYELCHDYYPEISIIKSDYSRYVVDLNRPKDRKKLYSDGRPENSFVPTSSFSGSPLYPTNRVPDEEEVSSRAIEFHDPYHLTLRDSLEYIKSQQGQALLIDAHSITRNVPQLVAHSLPDFMVGNYDQKSCSDEILDLVMKSIRFNPKNYSCVANQYFKGGFITRSHGKKSTPIQSIQIEMSQDLYLEDKEESTPKKSVSFMEIQALFKDLLGHLLNFLSQNTIYK